MAWPDLDGFQQVRSPAVLLLIPGVLAVHDRSRHRQSRARTAGAVGSVVALAVLVVGVALEFWTFSWGSYAVTVEEKGGVATAGGVVHAAASLVLAISLVPFGIGAVRARALPWWLVPVLVVGALATFYLTPAFYAPGVAWLLFGTWLLATPRRPRNHIDAHAGRA
jgi:hypothetical protein